MHTWAQSCLQKYVHMRNHFLTYMHTWARSCLQEYVHMRTIHLLTYTHTHTQMREHVHICMHTHVQSCVHVPGRGVIFAVHAMIRSGLEHHVFLSTFSSELFICALPGGSSRNPWRHCLASALLLFPCCLC